MFFGRQWLSGKWGDDVVDLEEFDIVKLRGQIIQIQIQIIQTLEVLILNFLDPSAKINWLFNFLRIVLFLTGTFYLLRLSMQNPSEYLMLNWTQLTWANFVF